VSFREQVTDRHSLLLRHVSPRKVCGAPIAGKNLGAFAPFIAGELRQLWTGSFASF
jgi:hypothetical protein